MGSMDTLVADLFAQPPTAARDALISKATAGEYHDFKSPHPTPKTALIGDLTHYGYRDLARKARSGAYGDRADAHDEATLLKDLADSPALADIDRRFRAGEITYEAAVATAMEMLDPADRVRAAVELAMGPKKPDK